MSAQTIQQMESARSLALGDGRYYPTIIPGVLPIIGYSADQSIEIQRWGADFLAEAFASPTWPPEAKESSAPSVLATLRAYLDNVEDKSVIKSAVQAAASVYPLVYRHTVADPNDAQNWQLMAAIKANILQRMDTAAPGVRMCCVKFLQQVVLVQTLGVMDPRRPDHSDISLAIVPRDHPLIPYASLEGEGHGLLDRLLDIIHSQHSDGLLITGTLNSLGVLMHKRPSIANKILNSIFNFNPLRLANSPLTPKNKVVIKSIERTTRALLVNVMKRNPENPANQRIQQFLERMHRTRQEAFDENSRKRPAPSAPTDGLDPAKRQRVTVAVAAQPPPVQELPEGPVSWAQLYTLNTESGMNFDVKAFQDIGQLVRILVPVLQSVDEQKLKQAIATVRDRWTKLKERAAQQAAAAPAEDEEEYEPDFEPETAEQVINDLEGTSPPAFSLIPGGSGALASFKLPDAPPLSEQDAQKYGDLTVRQVFSMLNSLDENPKNKVTKGGFNRLAASDYSRDAWLTIMTRLATRTSVGLDDPIKDEYAVKSATEKFKIGETVRDCLYKYVITDWKKRIDAAISWLNEEWYNDMIVAEADDTYTPNGNTNGHSSKHLPKGNYHRLVLRIFDGILPYISPGDKVLFRFLSEVPILDYDILVRLKKMAEDPERVELACQSMRYLYMFRPPVRGLVTDIAAELWRENDRAKAMTGKLLAMWRPEVLSDEAGASGMHTMKQEDAAGRRESANGALEVKAAM